MLGEDSTAYAFLGLVAAAVGGIAFALLYPYFSGEAQAQKRVARLSGKKTSSWRAVVSEDSRDQRRKQVQDTLNQIEEREKQTKKRMTLRLLLEQAGLLVSVRSFWLISIGLGAALGFLAIVASGNTWLAGGAAAVGALGLPRWAVGYLRKRRLERFLLDFADAIDVMVRGLKAGLPLNDALKVIASETPDPVGPEFQEVIDGQKVGIAIDQGIERMYERVPLAEVNFLSIVIGIQSKTGGNLAEALGNLSRVLRDRKKMKGKIRAVSQEAKASAAIIGFLPFGMMGALYLLRPDYISILWETQMGQIMMICSGIWMSLGILVMRKMINFDF